jgi:hypothetical protein
MTYRQKPLDKPLEKENIASEAIKREIERETIERDGE